MVGFVAGYALALLSVPVTVEIVPKPCTTALELLDDAHYVRLAVFLFSVYDGNECTDMVARRLTEIRAAGGDVAVFLDDSRSNERAITFFMEHNVPVYVYRSGTLHAKVLLADDCFLLGSSNYTKSGFFRNAEINVKVCGPPAAALRAWFQEIRVKSVSPPIPA